MNTLTSSIHQLFTILFTTLRVPFLLVASNLPYNASPFRSGGQGVIIMVIP
ncbi:hypothetical protein J9Z47_003539 [Salmonella enterica]|nr:hypothetical protein [Salmonella enterica]